MLTQFRSDPTLSLPSTPVYQCARFLGATGRGDPWVSLRPIVFVRHLFFSLTALAHLQTPFRVCAANRLFPIHFDYVAQNDTSPQSRTIDTFVAGSTLTPGFFFLDPSVPMCPISRCDRAS
jgi:hypothetical protein